MEKKFYLKPDTEVLDIMFENDLLAGTGNTPDYGNESDEYEFPIGPGQDAGGLQ